jgi:branched-chain amino acid transport system substrate-binding protein
VAAFIKRWQTTEKRTPNGLPYTQYLYDSPYIVAELFKWIAKNKLPATGENLRKALITIKDFDLPMTGMLEVGSDHRVKKPVYLLTVEKGAFVPLATIK